MVNTVKKVKNGFEVNVDIGVPKEKKNSINWRTQGYQIGKSIGKTTEGKTVIVYSYYNKKNELLEVVVSIKDI